ncbi:SpoIIE family protein phosphatase [Geothrix fermentans]|jgi:serine phosphatase RsbU (regulator of sigma subunit)|uniref:SpoIIE family protein phosphatase n=1 Tax=Geothrix fermentans TaxID=44676 RepID=UPI00041C47EF|nr:SpoIIE family protein phosphatase [Geothrix fermentans]
MKPLVLHIPGRPPFPLEGAGGAWTVGRSSQNDVVIADASLSRHHARITLKEGLPYLEDLGSLNGTSINGERIKSIHPLHEGDEILLGQVPLNLGPPQHGPRVRIHPDAEASSSAGSLVLPLDRLRAAPTRGVAPGTFRLREVVREIQGLSLELLEDSPPELLLSHLLDRIWTLLRPWRAAVLIQDAKAGLLTVASRGPEGHQPILLAQSLVEAALKRKESVLFNDAGDDPGLASPSLVSSGITSAMVTPLEHRGVVKGLLYLDCRPPRPPFDEEDLRLASTLAHLATAKLEQARMREEALARKKVDQELDLARHIQQGLLPGFPPELEGFEVHGNNLPSRQVSGDLFGWWPRQDGQWLLCLADVSGKGLGPGLLMASMQATLEAWTERDLAVDDLAFRLSRAVARHTDGRRFITAFLALLDPSTGVLTYTNAGHNPGLFIHRGGEVDLLESQGLPIGMLPGNPYGAASLQMWSGDLLALYTDGLTESASPAGEEFGEAALAAFLAERRAEPLLAIDAHLMDELDRHTRGAPYLDDRTILLVRRT